MKVDELSRSVAVVDSAGRPTQELHLFSVNVASTVNNTLPISGNGNPNGVVEAPSDRMYFDRTGAPGSRLYWKEFDDVGGDKKLGWIMV